jgi:predicted neuraminidase
MKTPALVLLPLVLAAADAPSITKEDIFPLDAKHNHASSLVELPNGDLLVCWYRGSGERTADDVVIMAARKKKGARAWSAPYVLADTPDFPDTNPTFFLDARARLWLFYQVIVANQWETAITKMRVTGRWQTDPVRWDESDILLVKPPNFAERVDAYYRDLPAPTPRLELARKHILEKARDKYFSRLGWMTRAHPTQLASGRILLPLYSDGYSFSLVAISDDHGATWRASEPIVGLGNIQPSIVARQDGTLVAYMRDNGPAPKRVQWSDSRDKGETWTPARDTGFANSGTGLEAIVLKDGRWLMVNNDTETGRYRLTLSLSDDEGRTWKWSRAVEHDTRAERPASFHYPSLCQARDGSLLLSYSYFLNHLPEGQPRKTIRFARFNTAWLTETAK